MAQGVYIGVNGVARKITGGYIGVDNKARKITKAYIGIGGVARPCWSAEKKVKYYGTITPLSTARTNLAATTVGNYALFAGGAGDSTHYATVDAYNKSLTRSIPTELSRARSNLAATTVGDYAIFAGGKASSLLNTVDAYDMSLTRSTPTALGFARYGLAAASVGDYAVIYGGITSSSNSTARATIDVYDKSLSKVTSGFVIKYLQIEGWAATSLDNYALFGGGNMKGTLLSYVEAYDASLTSNVPTPLSVARHNLVATTVGNYALFGGGTDGSNPVATVDAYDSSLTKSVPTALINARSNLTATTVDDFALFSGGINGSGEAVPYVQTYDISLTVNNFSSSTDGGLSVGRYNLVAATIGKYAIFAGGQTSESTFSDVAEAYMV